MSDEVSQPYHDFKKELYDYCNSDVDTLRRGCLELRKQFLEIANIDPFRYITIAGVCMVIYRVRLLKLYIRISFLIIN
jgi:hypothetical protein